MARRLLPGDDERVSVGAVLSYEAVTSLEKK
jgi:hypothetical protein